MRQNLLCCLERTWDYRALLDLAALGQLSGSVERFHGFKTCLA